MANTKKEVLSQGEGVRTPCTLPLDSPLNFQSSSEKPAFECPCVHPIILFLSFLAKNSMDRVSVVCKLAMKWYLMRMCASCLCPFERAKTWFGRLENFNLKSCNYRVDRL